MTPKIINLGASHEIVENPGRANERKLYSAERAAEVLSLPYNQLQNLIALTGLRPSAIRMGVEYTPFLTDEDIRGISGYLAACPVISRLGGGDD